MAARPSPVAFAYRPTPDLTAREYGLLLPYLLGRRSLTSLDWYLMGSESRHLIVVPATLESAC